MLDDELMNSSFFSQGGDDDGGNENDGDSTLGVSDAGMHVLRPIPSRDADVDHAGRQSLRFNIFSIVEYFQSAYRERKDLSLL